MLLQDWRGLRMTQRAVPCPCHHTPAQAGRLETADHRMPGEAGRRGAGGGWPGLVGANSTRTWKPVGSSLQSSADLGLRSSSSAHWCLPKRKNPERPGQAFTVSLSQKAEPQRGQLAADLAPWSRLPGGHVAMQKRVLGAQQGE